MKQIKANHCWHWAHTSVTVGREQEECCNCGLVIEEMERWVGNPGKCEWESEE